MTMTLKEKMEKEQEGKLKVNTNDLEEISKKMVIFEDIAKDLTSYLNVVLTRESNENFALGQSLNKIEETNSGNAEKMLEVLKAFGETKNDFTNKVNNSLTDNSNANNKTNTDLMGKMSKFYEMYREDIREKQEQELTSFRRCVEDSLKNLDNKIESTTHSNYMYNSIILSVILFFQIFVYFSTK